jgi:hypothetical protein
MQSRSKRAETVTLLDSGATQNFMNLQYAKYLHLPIKNLQEPRKLFNVDGTLNRARSLKQYVDLATQTRTKQTTLWYFLMDLGENKVILGYPWFTAAQPQIDWARGWINHAQLPIVLCSSDAAKDQFTPRFANHAWARIIAQRLEVNDEKEEGKIPHQYQWYTWLSH